MMLLAVAVVPLSFAVLFVVMSWTEQALDHELGRQVTSLVTTKASGR